MKVNERPFTAGLAGPWDEAIESGDPLGAIDLLMRVAMVEENASATVDSALANPGK
jgi:hypothetical protein